MIIETLETFLSNFWAPFLGACIGFALGWGIKRSLTDSRVLFLSAAAFPELSARGKLEQRRLIEQASERAALHWRSFLPPLVFVLCFASGAATSATLIQLTANPIAWWVNAVIWIGFSLLGHRLAVSLTTHYFRPFLRASLEQTGQRVL